MARPTKITTEVVKKLEEALKLDMPVEKACKYSDISAVTFYARCKKDKAFLNKMTQARYFATKIARSSVIKHMVSDGNLALKYLERKESDEFNTKQNVVQTNMSVELSKQEQEAVKKSLLEVGVAEPTFDPEEDEN